MIKTILKKEKRKIIATVIVAGFFLFFWINGPFQQIFELINLEKETTEYSNPKMVGGLDGKKKSNFGRKLGWSATLRRLGTKMLSDV